MGGLYYYQSPEGATAAKIWEGFTGHTTCHGIAHVDRAQGLVKRAVWGFLFLGISACLVVSLTIISRDFLSHDVVVNIDLQQQAHLEFPAITVCNMNPVRRSAIEGSTMFSEGLATGVNSRKKRAVYEACENGWQSYGSSCYRFESQDADKKNYNDAKADCAKDNAQLVSINDEDENDWIVSITTKTTHRTHWTGLECSSFYWMNGYSSTWHDIRYLEGDCVRFWLSHGWLYMYGDYCGEHFYFVCRKSTASCSSPWSMTSGGCFYVSSFTRSHSEADAECRDLGGRLASFDSKQQADDVFTSKLNNPSYKKYWMGYRRNCTWADGTLLEDDDFQNWISGEGGRWTHMRIRDTGEWASLEDSEFRRYICEKKAVTITTAEATTETPTTLGPSTEEPTTLDLTTQGPTTSDPTTQGPTTSDPTTQGPTTSDLTTQGPTTSDLTTQGPTTSDPTTQGPTTSDLTTQGPTTSDPTTHGPTTSYLTTQGPTTSDPTTQGSTACDSTAQGPTTLDPALKKQTTIPSTTHGATSLKSTTEPFMTLKQTTDEPLIQDCGVCLSRCNAHSPEVSSAKSDWTTKPGPSINTFTTMTTTTTTMTSTTTTMTSTTTRTAQDGPEPVEGSKFLERVETREDFKAEVKVTEVLSMIDLEEKQKLGYSAEDLILDCQYAGYDCFSREFAEFYNAVHGNCFVFNSGWNSSHKIFTSERSGRRYGLHLTLNILQDEYIEQAGDTAGVRLVVHPQWRMPFPEDEGVSISPGHVTAVGIRKVIIERQSSPYGSCITPTNSPDTNVYSELYPVRYSTVACQKTCYQKHVIEQCQCADANYPLTGSAFGPVNVSACRTSNVEEGDCLYDVEQKFKSNALECDCPTSCRDVAYGMELSVAQWPADIAKEELLNSLRAKIGSLLDDPNDPEKYKRNLVKIEVFYEEFNYEIVSESPRYPVWNFLSDIGGLLGLWLGCSMLTLSEFIELLMDLCVFGFCRLLQAGDRKPPSRPAASRPTTSGPESSRQASSHVSDSTCHGSSVSAQQPPESARSVSAIHYK